MVCDVNIRLVDELPVCSSLDVKNKSIQFASVQRSEKKKPSKNLWIESSSKKKEFRLRGRIDGI